MQPKASGLLGALQKHPVAWPAFAVFTTVFVAVYILFVVTFTVNNGLSALPEALLMPIPVISFVIFMSVFPFWCENHPTVFTAILIGEFLLLIGCGLLSFRPRFRWRAFLWVLLVVVAATNLALNFLYPNWSD
jgi:hypothetical protein